MACVCQRAGFLPPKAQRQAVSSWESPELTLGTVHFICIVNMYCIKYVLYQNNGVFCFVLMVIDLVLLVYFCIYFFWGEGERSHYLLLL